MLQELRRLIMNAEEPTPQRNTLYDYNGPDTKTCARLVGLLVEHKSARLVKLAYTQQGLLEPKEVGRVAGRVVGARGCDG